MRTLTLIDRQPMETLPELNNREQVFVEYVIHNHDLKTEHRIIDVVGYEQHCWHLKPRDVIKTTPVAWSYTATFAEEKQ